MAFATQATVGAKTKLEYDDFTTPGTFHLLATANELPEMGDSIEPVNSTPLHADDHSYVDGDKKEPDDIELVLQDVPGNADHEAFIDRAKAYGTAKLKITYSHGRIATFDVRLLGAKVQPPQRNAIITIKVMAKRTGAIAWSATV